MTLNPWLMFAISALVVVLAANALARYGDVIAVRTRLGGLLMGTIFLAAATSLPELLTAVNSFRVDAPNLAVGNFFGSNMVNILILAVIDIIIYQVPLLRRMAISHTLTAVLGSILMLVAVIFIMADLDWSIAWVGIDSLILIGLYFGGVWLIQQENKRPLADTGRWQIPVSEHFPTLGRGVIGFAGAAAVLVLVVPTLVEASTQIAELSGLGESFVGTTLLSLVTSLPELLAAIAAVRIGAFDMAVGNLFGSIVFNMLGLGISDFFYTDGPLLSATDPIFVLVGLLGLLLLNMALLGTLARLERKIFFIEIDAIMIVIIYFLGTYLIFIRGLGS